MRFGNRNIPGDIMTRIAPLEPPYAADVGALLEGFMPPGQPPIALFRTFARNVPMTDAMGAWGGYELNRRLSLTLRDREIVIDRTCARCHCEYEWGVHVAYFAEKARLTPDQIASLTHGRSTDPCWESERDRLLVRAADALHDYADIGEPLWTALTGEFDDAQLLDLTMLCGWYHAISFTASAARVALEDWAPRFADFDSSSIRS
jgi:alkylhydroperoxidase family enzyme